MAGPGEVMTRKRGRNIDVDPEIIDQILSSLPAQSNGGDTTIPQKTDINSLARHMGVSVRRGPADEVFEGISIPTFYSEREARLAVARVLALHTVRKIADKCEVNAGKHDCPSEEICRLVERAESEPQTLDRIAAAMLMPTADFTKWARILKGEVEPLADTYAVPIELARIRTESLDSEEEVAN